MKSGIVTLTTDFGADGPYVASMKGILLGLAPDARLVDVSHAIPPQNVRAAGYVLAEVVPCFPRGTVHLAVVDPGVGTSRRLVAVLFDDQWFVLPDNGLISATLGGREPKAAWELTEPGLRRRTVSATFHGRDILAPAAAFLLRGGDPFELGAPVNDLVTIPPVEPVEIPAGFAGEVVHVDPFGNLITNLTRDHLGPDAEAEGWSVAVGPEHCDLVHTYGDRPPGDLVALVGSTGRVEVAVVNGSAARHLDVGRGATLALLRPSKSRP